MSWRSSMHVMLCWLLLALPVVALAQQDSIRIGNAWSRAAVQGANGVVYVTITDDGAPDRLLSVASQVAAKAELHESFTEQGVEAGATGRRQFFPSR